jgi:hypothetical protein
MALGVSLRWYYLFELIYGLIKYTESCEIAKGIHTGASVDSTEIYTQTQVLIVQRYTHRRECDPKEVDCDKYTREKRRRDRQRSDKISQFPSLSLSHRHALFYDVTLVFLIP